MYEQQVNDCRPGRLKPRHRVVNRFGRPQARVFRYCIYGVLRAALQQYGSLQAVQRYQSDAQRRSRKRKEEGT